MQKFVRKLDIAVISDLHLATLASNARLILKYLKTIHPKTLVLNGDIIDSWRFSRNYFPKSHLKVIRQLVKMIEKGVQVVYITGNHDDIFRKFNNTRLGRFSIVNQLEITHGSQRTWIFHGDIFDHIIHHSPWLAKFGAAAYGLLTVFNAMLNFFLRLFGGKDMILYKSMKDYILKEKKVLSNFEMAILNAAINKNVDVVICGHTHIPADKILQDENGKVRYINCGDWVEHFTAAECLKGQWSLNYFAPKAGIDDEESSADEPDIPDKNQIYQSLLKEMKILST
jgi:UDP-2,3-diacylglucosamine pyrophosphatase LpxH